MTHTTSVMSVCVCVLSCSILSDSCDPHPWDSPGKNTGVDCHFLHSHMTKPSWDLKSYPCDFKFCALLNVFAFFIFKQQIAYLFILNKILKQTSERDKSSSSPSVASPWHLCSMHQLNNYSISYGSFFYKSTPSKKTQSKNILIET